MLLLWSVLECVFQGGADSLPDGGSFFSFCKIKFGHQFAEALMRNRSAVFVIIFDDILLVGRSFFHHFFACVDVEFIALSWPDSPVA